MRIWWVVLLSCLVCVPARAAEPALEQTSEIELEARDAARLIDRLTALTRELGGQLVNAQPSSATLTLPSARYAELRRRLRELGAVRSERRAAIDLDPEIADAEAAIAAARRRRDRVAGLEPLARGVQESLMLEREREGADRELAEAEARARTLRARSGRTRVTIRYQAQPVESVSASRLPFPWLDELGLERLTDPNPRPREPAYELRALIDGQIGAFAGKVRDPERLGDADYTLGVATSLRALGESSPVGIFGGFDLSLGYGSGFAYGAQTLLGLGMPIGSRFAFGLGSGPGIDGITGGVVPFGVNVPIELYTLLDASLLEVTAYARTGWVFASDARDEGSPHAPLGDELSAGIRLGFGGEDGFGYSRERAGPRIGFGYRELMDTAIYEITIAFGASELDLSESY